MQEGHWLLTRLTFTTQPLRNQGKNQVLTAPSFDALEAELPVVWAVQPLSPQRI
jgi:hypothetical protein